MARDTDAVLRALLSTVYGSAQALAQVQRYSDALDLFRTLAGPGPAAIVRAPGRVNLIGEHTDYNHGYVLPMALDKDTVLVARLRPDHHVRLWNSEPARFHSQEFDLSDQIAPAPLGDWSNYVRAAAQALFLHSKGAVRGIDVLVEGAPPLGTPRAAGLSSSSALLVAAALAFAALNRLAIPRVAFARMCSEAEWYVGTRGGIMDHFISVLAERGHALLLDCRPQTDSAGDEQYQMTPVPIPDGYRFIICNSTVQREKTRSLYNVRVAECRLAVTLLQAVYPQITHLRDASAAGLGVPESRVADAVASLPESLNLAAIAAQPALAQALQALNTQFHADQVFVIRARARHVVSENARVLAGVAALRAGDAAGFGRLMNEAHESMRRDYDASCREVDILAQIARDSPGVLGARVTGAGWGGCVVALANEASEGFERKVSTEYKHATGLTTDIFVCRSGPGASVVGDV